MMKGPSIFELSLEASCWWMKIKSVVKRRWASEMAACPVASTFCVLKSRRGPVNKEVGILQDLEFTEVYALFIFGAWDDGFGGLECQSAV